jgi:hypothetical protein
VCKNCTERPQGSASALRCSSEKISILSNFSSGQHHHHSISSLLINQEMTTAAIDELSSLDQQQRQAAAKFTLDQFETDLSCK